MGRRLSAPFVTGCTDCRADAWAFQAISSSREASSAVGKTMRAVQPVTAANKLGSTFIPRLDTIQITIGRLRT